MVCVSPFADFIAQKGKWSPWVEVCMKRQPHSLTDRSNRPPLVKQNLYRAQRNSRNIHRSGKWNLLFGTKHLSLSPLALSKWNPTKFCVWRSLQARRCESSSGTLPPWPSSPQRRRERQAPWSKHFPFMSTSFIHTLLHRWKKEHFISYPILKFQYASQKNPLCPQGVFRSQLHDDLSVGLKTCLLQVVFLKKYASFCKVSFIRCYLGSQCFI